MENKLTVGTEIAVIVGFYKNVTGTIEKIEGGGFWDYGNEKVYKVKLNGFRGYLWFSCHELTVKTEWLDEQALVKSEPLVDWLSK